MSQVNAYTDPRVSQVRKQIADIRADLKEADHGELSPLLEMHRRYQAVLA